jgi:L-lactate dehydrogenase
MDIYVLGVQGEQQVAVWSSATIGGVPLDKVLPAGTIDKEKITADSAERSHQILLAKGSMPFGVGSVIASVCASVLFDERKVRPISYYEADFGCCFSRLAALGRQGVAASLPTAMSESEMGQMVESAERLAETLSRINDL